MATTPTTVNPADVLCTVSAWGYLPLREDHAGVRAAWDVLKDPRGIRWDLIANIARMAGHAADDLVIVGGPEVAEMLVEIHSALTVRFASIRR